MRSDSGWFHVIEDAYSTNGANSNFIKKVALHHAPLFFAKNIFVKTINTFYHDSVGFHFNHML
jgi:hypothetical protein